MLAEIAPGRSPWFYLGLFLACSLLMLWRLEAMTAKGVEGTVLGTLVMPYCSGMGNLIFAFLIGSQGGPGADVVTNALVNNATNLTLLIGLPAIFWNLGVLAPKAKARRKKAPDHEPEMHRLSLLLTLVAVAFFTGALWALARDGRLDRGDGLVLVGLFLFWQAFHVFEVLKSNVRKKKGFSWSLPLDLGLLAAGAYGIYLSTQWLVDWVNAQDRGFISAEHLGWLSGWLMVLPNAMLGLYYAWRGNPEVVYTSQVGDGHICIPLCVGIIALYRPAELPPFFTTGILVLLAAAAVHFFFILLLGRLPRWAGAALVLIYLGSVLHVATTDLSHDRSPSSPSAAAPRETPNQEPGAL